MSREAWGDEGDIGPDGYVTEEYYEELKTAHREAVELLKRARRSFLYQIPLATEIDEWLKQNTVNGEIPE